MFLDAVDGLDQQSGGDAGEAVVFHLKLEDGDLEARRIDADRVRKLLDTETDVRFLDLYV